jgi:ketopantoate reductase
VIQPAKATDDPRQIGPVYVIFLGVKAWQVEEAARTRNMEPMVGAETFVVPLQNGVEAPSQLAALAPGKIRNIGASLSNSENSTANSANEQKYCVRYFRKLV